MVLWMVTWLACDGCLAWEPPGHCPSPAHSTHFLSLRVREDKEGTAQIPAAWNSPICLLEQQLPHNIHCSKPPPSPLRSMIHPDQAICGSGVAPSLSTFPRVV